MPTEPLHRGRGDALSEASGTFTITGMSVGDEVWVLVDHSAQVQFADNPLPAIEELDGFALAVVATGPEGGSTDGSGFVVHVRCVQDNPYGYGQSEAVSVSWTRKGYRI